MHFTIEAGFAVDSGIVVDGEVAGEAPPATGDYATDDAGKESGNDG